MTSVTRQMLITLNVSMFLVTSGFGIVLPILPYFARDMGASSLEMGLMLTLFALSQFIFSPLWGNLSDRIGRRPILLWGLVGYSLSFFAMAAATSVSTLLLARCVSGILSAAAFPTVQALVADCTSDRERAGAIGTMAASMNLGFILGPMMGGAMAPLGMRTVFVLSGSFVLITAAVMTWTLREPVRSGEHSPVTFGQMVAAFPQALRQDIGIYLVLTLIATFGGASMFSLFSFYLMDKVNALPVQTGYAFTVMGAGSAVVQYLLVGPCVAAIGEQPTIILSLALGAVSLVIAATGSTLGMLLFGAFMIGAALGLLRPTLTTGVSTRTRFGQGFTMGLHSSFDSLGRMLGPLWAGFIYSYGMSLPFWSSAVLFAAAMVVTAVIHIRSRMPGVTGHQPG